MTSVTEHYAKHLAPIYLWMAGGSVAAIEAGTAEIEALNLPLTPGAVVIDLGAGFGMHAIPLARKRARVTAINTSIELLRTSDGWRTQVSHYRKLRRVLGNPDIWDPQKGFSALFAEYSNGLKHILDAIQASSVQTRQVVIAHPFAVPGAVIGRERGLVQSVVAAYLASSNLRTCHDPLTIGALCVPRWVPMSWRRALWRFVEKGWIDPVAVSQLRAPGHLLDEGAGTNSGRAPGSSAVASLCAAVRPPSAHRGAGPSRRHRHHRRSPAHPVLVTCVTLHAAS